METFALGQGSTQSVSGSGYTACEWDEADFEEIGVIRYTVTGTGTRGPLDYFISNSPRLYSIESNPLVGALNIYPSEMEAVLFDRFEPALQGTKLGAATMELHGMPWVEPGDVIEASVSAGQETVEILVTRQEFSGVQLLMQNVEEAGTEMTGGQYL